MVAGEVKNLSSQTAKATEGIVTQVEAIRSATRAAVDALADVAGTINEINEIAGVISEAADQQSQATQDIARNVQEAAIGTREVSRTIQQVSQAANETENAAGAVLTAAGDLSQRSNGSLQAIDRFLGEIRGEPAA